MHDHPVFLPARAARRDVQIHSLRLHQQTLAAAPGKPQAHSERYWRIRTRIVFALLWLAFAYCLALVCLVVAS